MSAPLTLSAASRPDSSNSGRVPMAALDLQASADAARVAADDALALAGRTDHLTHLCGEDAGQCLRGMADATRQHAEDLDRGALFLRRCALFPGLPAMIAAMEAGATFVPVDDVRARVVVAGQHEAAANDMGRPSLLRRLFQWAA